MNSYDIAEAIAELIRNNSAMECEENDVNLFPGLEEVRYSPISGVVTLRFIGGSTYEVIPKII